MKLNLGIRLPIHGKAGFQPFYCNITNSLGEANSRSALLKVNDVAVRLRESTDSLREALLRSYEA